MRDVKRIKPFLEEIGKLWEEKFPDYRFGQLMEIFRTRYGDTFYLEEEEFLEKFRECCGLTKEEPRLDFSLLSNIGFDDYDLKWLYGHDPDSLKLVYEYYYTPTALNNLTCMLEMGFSNRVAIALWMYQGDGFLVEESEFKKDVQSMVNKFGKNNIENYFWKNGEFPLFYYIGDDEEEKKAVTERIQEYFREERRENMKQLVKIGFGEQQVKDLEEVYNEFFLDMIEEYYMEPVHLKKLKELLEIGFHESVLLQLYITEPERIFEDFSIDVVEKRLNQIENVWEIYEDYEDIFLDALFSQDEEMWDKLIKTLRG